MMGIRWPQTGLAGLVVLVACAPPSALPPEPAPRAEAPSVSAAPPPDLGLSAELLQQVLERSGFFELDYCRAFPPALVELEPRDAGCGLPSHTCVRDEAGRIVENSVLDASGTAAVKGVLYSYDGEGRLATSTVERGGGCLVESTYERDDQGRLVREAMRDHCGSKETYWIRYEYDENGRVVTIEQVEHYGDPSLGTRTRALEYDPNGRLATSRDEDGTLIELEYDRWGHCLGFTEDGKIDLRYERDAEGTVVASETEWFRATLERDDEGRVVRKVVQDKLGRGQPDTVVYRYDDQGRCVRVESDAGIVCDYDPPYPGTCPDDVEPNSNRGCVVNY